MGEELATYFIEMPYCATCSKPDFHTNVTSQEFVAWRRQERKADTALPPTEVESQRDIVAEEQRARRSEDAIAGSSRKRRAGARKKSGSWSWARGISRTGQNPQARCCGSHGGRVLAWLCWPGMTGRLGDGCQRVGKRIDGREARPGARSFASSN